VSVECGEGENMNQESGVTQYCTKRAERKERRELRTEAKKKRRKEEEPRQTNLRSVRCMG